MELQLLAHSQIINPPSADNNEHKENPQMVYKIQYSSQQSLNNLFYKLEKIGDFIYAHETIYLHSAQTKQFIKSKLKSKGVELFITEVNPSNLHMLPNNVNEFCKIRLLAEEKARYERENQEALKELNDLMDEVEKELILQSQRKEVDNATSKESITGNDS